MWYYGKEVNPMEEEKNLPEQELPEQEHYVPRPQWQVWAARIGLAAFLVFLVLYYLNILGVSR